MNAETKLKMFTQVHYDLHMAKSWSDEIKHGGLITKEQISELLRRTTKANASCQAFERAMQGVPLPKLG